MRCAADERDAQERLCRYMTRPALANERVQINAASQVVLKLKNRLARRHNAPGIAGACAAPLAGPWPGVARA